MSDTDDFIQLVWRMREQQRAYFRTRSSSTLDDCKRLEKEVDERIEELLDQQTKLFDS